MSKVHDNFIEKYKELETLLVYVPVRDYEEQLTHEGLEKTAEKLRLCRYFRNYISHNPDYEKMLTITPEMQAFLDDMVRKIHLQSGIAKDHMVTLAKYGKLTVNDAILDAALLLHKKKKDALPVFDKNDEYIGHISKSIVSDLVALNKITSTTKINKYVDSLSKYPCKVVPADTPMDMIDNIDQETLTFVSNKTGKIIGIL